MEMRLDAALVERGIVPSRERAKEYIKAGKVQVNGKPAGKPAMSVTDEDQLELVGETLRYVSRGGLKLEKALQTFPIELSGKTCLDIGASTGGFTDCMLQNGAAHVVSVDVGTDQLAEKLRLDPRVTVMEQTNVRYLTKEILAEKARETDFSKGADFASIDVSFISLTKVLEPVQALLAEGAEMVCLIKPQFEAGRGQIGKKGVVKEPSVHRDVIRAVTFFAESIGLEVLGLTYSPIRGPEGNIEYLVWLRKAKAQAEAKTQAEAKAEEGPSRDLTQMIGRTVTEAFQSAVLV